MSSSKIINTIIDYLQNVEDDKTVSFNVRYKKKLSTLYVRKEGIYHISLDIDNELECIMGGADLRGMLEILNITGGVDCE